MESVILIIFRQVYHQHVAPVAQVFDRDKRYKRSIYIGAPVTAVCYLNDDGDILVAMGLRLVVLRASQYDKAPTSKKVGVHECRTVPYCISGKRTALRNQCSTALTCCCCSPHSQLNPHSLTCTKAIRMNARKAPPDMTP